jgi:hypothetical protein
MSPKPKPRHLPTMTEAVDSSSDTQEGTIEINTDALVPIDKPSVVVATGHGPAGKALQLRVLDEANLAAVVSDTDFVRLRINSEPAVVDLRALTPGELIKRRTRIGALPGLTTVAAVTGTAALIIPAAPVLGIIAAAAVIPAAVVASYKAFREK